MNIPNASKAYEDSQRLSEDQAAKLLAALPDCEVASTVAQDEDEDTWVQERLLGIGGSDVGSILGVNKYSSARMVYLTKLGMYEPHFSDEAKERMSWGHILEPVVADKFSQVTGKRVVISPATLRNKEYPWARANVDRFIVDDEGKPVGILEVKTANWRLNEDWANGEIPMSYIYQLQWYLKVTGLRYGAFAALVGGNNFHYYEVFYNDELMDFEIFPACKTFWEENVLKGVEPALTGADADNDYVKEKFVDVEKNSEIDLREEEWNELAELVKKNKAAIKELEREMKEAENKLKEKMATNELAYTIDHTIKWSPRTQNRIDTDKLKMDYPEIYEQVRRQISYRVFQIK